MGALPKKRLSKKRTNQRRSHHALSTPTISKCLECNQPKLAHQVCPNCGTYNGKKVVG